MIDVDATQFLDVLLALLAGALLGAVYWIALWRATRSAMARRAVGPLLAGMALRLGLAAGALACAAALGASAPQILAAALGLGLARRIATRRIGEAR